MKGTKWHVCCHFILKRKNFKTTIVRTANADLLAHQNIDHTDVELTFYNSNCECLRAL